jgi:hypothetical protein
LTPPPVEKYSIPQFPKNCKKDHLPFLGGSNVSKNGKKVRKKYEMSKKKFIRISGHQIFGDRLPLTPTPLAQPPSSVSQPPVCQKYAFSTPPPVPFW